VSVLRKGRRHLLTPQHILGRCLLINLFVLIRGEAAVPRSRSPTQEEEDELLAASPDVNDEGHEERTVEGPSGRSPGPSPGALGKS
jgi:hypothetical protein